MHLIRLRSKALQLVHNRALYLHRKINKRAYKIPYVPHGMDETDKVDSLIFVLWH